MAYSISFFLCKMNLLSLLLIMIIQDLDSNVSVFVCVCCVVYDFYLSIYLSTNSIGMANNAADAIIINDDDDHDDHDDHDDWIHFGHAVYIYLHVSNLVVQLDNHTNTHTHTFFRGLYFFFFISRIDFVKL